MSTWGWVAIGLLVLIIFGRKWFAAWLTPGVPPPGPLG
jgi:hypothetical protein